MRNVRTPMRAIRWLLTIPASVLGLSIGFGSGVLVYMIGEWTCPAGYIVGGSCAAPWSLSVFVIALESGNAIGHCLIVTLPALVAPSYKRLVAVTAFLGACILAAIGIFSAGGRVLVFGFTTLTAVVALSAGVGSLIVVFRTTSGSSNSSLDSDAPEAGAPVS